MPILKIKLSEAFYFEGSQKVRKLYFAAACLVLRVVHRSLDLDNELSKKEKQELHGVVVHGATAHTVKGRVPLQKWWHHMVLH